MADQEDFPDIYIDESVSSGGVGSEADPYSDFDEINWTTGGDNSIFDHYAGAETDNVTINLKKGEEWREQLTVGGSGSATYPILIQAYGSGAKPIINGSDIITTWSDASPPANSWSATLTTEPEMVFFDGTRGTKESSEANLNAANEWYWSSNVLYVYSTSDPDTAYTDPGIEATKRTRCIYGTGKDYITIDGLNIRYSDSLGIAEYQGDNLIIQNCDFLYTFGSAVVIQDTCTNCLIDSVYLDHCGYSGKQDNTAGENMWIADAVDTVTIKNSEINVPYACPINIWHATNVTIENNYVHDFDHNGAGDYNPGIYFDGCTNGIVRYNIVENCNLGYSVNSEIALVESIGIEFYYNISISCQIGFYVGCLQAAQNISNIDVYNNIFYKDDDNGSFFSDISWDYVDGLNFKNNIVINVDADQNDVLLYWGNSADNVVADYNDWYTSKGYYHFNCAGSGYFPSFAQYQTGMSSEANSITSDPLFVDAANDDFHLQAGSPCRNVGTDVSLTEDYDGVSVPQETNPALGAFEYDEATLEIHAILRRR